MCAVSCFVLVLFLLINQVNFPPSASMCFNDTSHRVGLTVWQPFSFVSSLEIKSPGNMLLP